MPCLKHHLQELEEQRARVQGKDAGPTNNLTQRPHSFYIYGKAEGEHLRADVRGDEIVLVSQERAVTQVDTQWRERVLVTIPCRVWRAISAMLED